MGSTRFSSLFVQKQSLNLIPSKLRQNVVGPLLFWGVAGGLLFQNMFSEIVLVHRYFTSEHELLNAAEPENMQDRTSGAGPEDHWIQGPEAYITGSQDQTTKGSQDQRIIGL